MGNCEQLLEGAGVLERLISSQNMASVRLDSDLPTLVDLLPKQAKVRRRVLQAVERLVGPRRNELVPVPAPRPGGRDELDADSIADALRELNELGAFTYVPPFRGRAIRMIRRDVPFDKLDIDFAEQEVRKDAEYGEAQPGDSLRPERGVPAAGDPAVFRRKGRRRVRPLRQLPPRRSPQSAPPERASAGRGRRTSRC